MEYIADGHATSLRTTAAACSARSPTTRARARARAAASSRTSCSNKFPYNPGHLLVVPLRHVGDVEDLTAEENAELAVAAAAGVRALREESEPHGFNVGHEPRTDRRRRHPRAPALARRPALERRHELHAGGRGDPGAARAARRDRAAARPEVRRCVTVRRLVDARRRRTAPLRDRRRRGPRRHAAAPGAVGLAHVGSAVRPVGRAVPRDPVRPARLRAVVEPPDRRRRTRTCATSWRCSTASGVERTALVGLLDGRRGRDRLHARRRPSACWALVPVAPGLGGFEATEEEEAWWEERRRADRGGDRGRRVSSAHRICGWRSGRRSGTDDAAGARDPRDRLRQHPRDDDGRERRGVELDPPAAHAARARSTCRRWSSTRRHDPPDMRAHRDLIAARGAGRPARDDRGRPRGEPAGTRRRSTRPCCRSSTSPPGRRPLTRRYLLCASSRAFWYSSITFCARCCGISS